MSPSTSLSYSAAVVLQAVANEYRYGFDIMDMTGLPSGTVYPALRRMEEAGLVVSRWESEAAAQREGGPARKYYGLGAGVGGGTASPREFAAALAQARPRRQSRAASSLTRLVQGRAVASAAAS